MTDTTNVLSSGGGLRTRHPTRADLTRLLPIARHTGLLAWAGDDPADYFDQCDVYGCVCGGGEGLTGFVLGATPRRGEPSPPAVFLPIVRSFRRRAGRGPAPLRIERLVVLVAPARPHGAVERELLSRFDRDLPDADGVEVVVPEADLAAQLYFRDAGYRATAILRGHYAGGDGYLMARPPR